MTVIYNKMPEQQFDFSGFATVYDTKCTDGRTIRHGAFRSQDGVKVPLVWHHLRNEPTNVLGHAFLEHKSEGVYVYGLFNKSDNGQEAKIRVLAKDIDALSIFANKLEQRGSLVHSGKIREVSLVISGANPGAKIDNLTIEHGDGSTDTMEDEAIIFSGMNIIVHDDNADEEDEENPMTDEKKIEHKEDETVGDVLATMSEKQRNVVYALISNALEDGDIEQSDEEGESMKHNVFDNGSGTKQKGRLDVLNGSFAEILKTAQRTGSLRDAVLMHAEELKFEDGELDEALQHDSITNVSYLFPDAKLVRQTPDVVRNDSAWMNVWMNGTRHLPFSRVKSAYTDITVEDARARGWVTDSETAKQDLTLSILKRTTDPTTVYVRSKLSRDDILDITDFYVVAWMKTIQREKLNEEIARAGLIGDGRLVSSDDKIDASKIRPIFGDAAVYVHYLSMEHTVTDTDDIIDAIIADRRNLKGNGRPVMFVEPGFLSDMLLLKDTTGRRIYRNEAELASELRVSSIIEVDHFTDTTRVEAIGEDDVTRDLFAILVNPSDYSYGADKGGEIGMFDDFDIDFNQFKYLMETRCSGALTFPKSAMVGERKQAVEE